MDLNAPEKRQKLAIKDKNIKDSLSLFSCLSQTSTHLGSSFESKQIVNAHKNKNQGFAWEFNDIIKTGLGASNDQSIFIRKEREKESDQDICSQWKNARKNFFTKQITQKLIEDKIKEDQHKRIVQMFLNEQGRIQQFSLSKLILILSKEKGSQTNNEKHKVVSFNLQMLRKHHKLMQYLKKQLQAIEKTFIKKQRECFPIVEIIKQNFSCLKTIHIQYQTKLDHQFQQEYTYFVSAFEFFKLIHENHLLTKVTVKGVFIEKFQQFINSMSQTIEEEELSWINDLCPSKALQLTINTAIIFDADQTNEAFSSLSDLTFFIDLFGYVSDIRVQIKLSQWTQISQSADVLKSIWDQLRRIRSIKLQIRGKDCIYYCPAKCAMIIRSVIFGQLSSFTEIVSLSFINVHFSSNLDSNISLAWQESLKLLFKNNKINSFKLNNRLCFPVLPQTGSFELFCFSQNEQSFRREINYMPNMIRANQNLKNLKYNWTSLGFGQEWEISDRLMNQLQTLIIQYCNLRIAHVSPKSISNMKHLRIFSCNIEAEQFLSTMFPKFANLTRLELSYVNFGQQLLCLVSSPSLQELTIQNNNIITDEALQVIDSKWPIIKFIRLYNCEKMTGNAWSICKFKGLVELHCDQSILKKGKAAFLDLKRQGVKVQYITY